MTDDTPGSKASAALLGALQLPDFVPLAQVLRQCDAGQLRGCPPRRERRELLKSALAGQLMDEALLKRVEKACLPGEKWTGDELIVPKPGMPASCTQALAEASEQVDDAFADFWTHRTNAAWTRFGVRDRPCRPLPACAVWEKSMSAEERFDCRSAVLTCMLRTQAPKQYKAFIDCAQRRGLTEQLEQDAFGAEFTVAFEEAAPRCPAETRALLRKLEKSMRSTFSEYGIPDGYSARQEPVDGVTRFERQFAETETAYANLQTVHELLASTKNDQTVRHL